MATTELRRFFLKEVDSTSAHAQNLLLDQASPLPFVVQAAKQSAGRGQMGKTWQSPEGNLYLSFVYGGSSLSPEMLPLIPLQVGTLVGEWLATTFGLGIHSKWPNDILLSGKKLGGILCETTHHAHYGHVVVIGLGLNVNVAPAVGDYSTTSLKDELGSEVSKSGLNLKDVADSLVDYFARHFLLNQIDIQKTLQRAPNFLLREGMLWRQGRNFFLGGWHAENGALQIAGKDIFSVNHGLEYCYQLREDESEVPFVVADFGNTNLKLSCFSKFTDKEPSFHRSLPYASDWSRPFAELREELSQCGVSGTWPIYFVSVASSTGEVERACGKANFQLFAVPKRRVRLRSSVYDTKDLGMDRMAAIEGYLKYHSQRAAILVSLGTATTMDVVDRERNHKGGWILPGLQTAFTSLKTSTALLPELHPHKVELSYDTTNPQKAAALGYNTKTAMYFGVIQSQVTLIETLATQMQGAEIVLSGGYAEVLRPHIHPKFSVSLNPHLVSHGIQAFIIG